MAVHSRINDLRQRGHRIEHRNERFQKMIHSYYRLTTH
jgi:biotin operon repressor